MTRSFSRILVVFLLAVSLCRISWAQEEADATAAETPVENPMATEEAAKGEEAVIPRPKPEITGSGSSSLFFNFDNADLVEVINTIGSILKWNYIIDPNVGGTVSIHTEGSISKDDLPKILNTVLKINNVVRVQEDDLIHFVPVTDARGKVVYPDVGSDPDAIVPRQNFIIQVVKLEYIKTNEMVTVIKSYFPSGMDVVEYDKENILIISDIDSNVKRMMKIISVFDVDIFKDARVRIFPLSNAPAEEVAKELENIFKVYDYPTGTARGLGIAFFTISRINAVLTVATKPNLVDQAEKWVKDLDKSVSENKIGVFIYNVQNTKAEDLSEVLTKIFVRKTDKEQEYKKKVLKQKSDSETSKAAQKAPAGDAKAAEAAPPAEAAENVQVDTSMIEGEINIVTDVTTNSIIIKSTKRDYDIILDTIKKLDTFPKQVLIEVTVAEVLLDARTQLGIDWQYTHGFSGATGTFGTAASVTGANSIGSGLSYALKSTDKLTAALRASAQDNKVNILSSPRVIASDNQKAKIEIGEDVPIVTSVYRTNDVSSTATTVDQTIQYRSTGILLTVTPRINEAGLVQLEITQEVSEISEKSVEGVQSPVIYKRSAETSLAVNDSETIIIGGLMKQKKVKNNSGVPFLSKIPIIGYFFSYSSDNVEKTELMILITPRVIKGSDDSREISRNYMVKIDAIKEAFKDIQE